MRLAGDSGPLSSGHCPDAGLLVEHARGTLNSPEREQITSHLDSCEDCRDVMALWTRAPASRPDDRSGSAAASAPGSDPLVSQSDRSTRSMTGDVAPGSRPSRPEYPPRPGDVLVGKYEVLRVLGIGGMGVVLAAHHVHMGRTVAIKLMLPHAMSTEATERFLRESRAASQVQGEHVARVLDVGTLEDQTPFLVMEYLEGTDLARLLRNRGPLPVIDAVGFVLQACEALAEAHALGIVHRDLKPANLFVTARADGSPLVKVLDFGISKVTGTETRPERSLTKSQTVMGTPLYMSPEQLRSTRTVGPPTDLWALGCVLYELLAAAPAFWAESSEALGALIAAGPSPRIRDVRAEVPAEVEAIILDCLEKDPAQRIATAAELARRLGPFAPADMAISVERAARISRGAPALPFADTVSSERPPPMLLGTAGSFVRTQGNTGPKDEGRAQPRSNAGYLLASVLGLGLIGTVAYTFLSGAHVAEVPPVAALGASAPLPVPPSPPVAISELGVLPTPVAVPASSATAPAPSSAALTARAPVSSPGITSGKRPVLPTAAPPAPPPPSPAAIAPAPAASQDTTSSALRDRK
jgi:eukaryotic-like serine/threonine-protein kinase